MQNLIARLIAVPILAAPLVCGGSTFFTDTFGTSTLNSASPAVPTATATSYELSSTKAWNPAPSIGAGHLKFGIATTTSGVIEAQGLFASPAISLVVPGDFIQMSVTFTNTAGLLTQAGFWGFGMYNAGGVAPIGGGLNGTATTSASTAATGGAQNWKGYAAQIAFSGANSGFFDRQPQTAGTANNNQDLVTSGSSSSSYRNPSAVAVGTASTTPSVTLTVNGQYTEILTFTLTDSGALQLDSNLYAGADNTGALLSTMTATTSATPLTTTFDGLAFGWRATGNTSATTIDVNSITVTGQATAVTGPPDITSQPSAVSVPVGAAGAFTVGASGFGVTYQWRRYGTNLLNTGNISGANSDTLVISPASAADVASGANGYYVVVSGTGGFSTNSITNSLSLRTAAGLVWSGAGNVWDLNTSQSWLIGANPAAFNFGDSVIFDDTGIGNAAVTLTGNFLSASSVTVNASLGNDYVFSGTGSFAGPGTLRYIGGGHLTLSSANGYSGGTVISNATAYLVLNNYNALGTGPVTFGLAGGQMEIVPAGGASTGINGDLVVADDFTITYDASSSFGAVLLGNLSGTAGKTLTINYNNGGATVSRVREYGANTVYNGNLVLTDARTAWAPYNAGGVQTYNGIISGSGALVQRGSGTTLLNGANTYTGGTTPTTGFIGFGTNSSGSIDYGPIGIGPLFLAPEPPNLTGSGTVFASGGARSIANPIQYPSGTNNLTLIVGGTNALTFAGPLSLNGNDALGGPTNRVFQVTNTALTTFSGLISDGSAGFGLIKTGTGTLALNNTESYTGPTTVSNGTLQVNGQLDVGGVTVATNGILGGTGAILGAVTVQPGGALAPGNSISTLTINSNLTIAGNLLIELNKSASPTSDKTVVTGTLSNTGTGTVTVTNLGPALAPGDTFTLFSKAVANGNALTVTGASANWTNKLAIDGTISVVTTVPANPTNLAFSISGGSLTLSWPANYLGWLLQTNSVSVASSASWFTLPNSQNATQVVLPLAPGGSNVFYRMLRPF